MVTIEDKHIKKLETFSQQFNMIPLFAQAVSIANDKTIHLFIISVEDIKKIFPKTKKGYSLNFSKRKIQNLINNDRVDYSVWGSETIGNKDFI